MNVDAIDTFLRGGADPGTPLRHLAPLPGASHEYDELIDSLFVFLQALIRARARDIGATSVVARSPAVVARPAPAASGPRRRQHSPETRAKTAAAARERYAREREQKARAGR